jgi:hypothetical protein
MIFENGCLHMCYQRVKFSSGQSWQAMGNFFLKDAFSFQVHKNLLGNFLAKLLDRQESRYSSN